MLSGSNNVNAVVLQLFPFFWSFISDDGLEKQMLNLDFNFWRPVAIKVLDEEVRPYEKESAKTQKISSKMTNWVHRTVSGEMKKFCTAPFGKQS